MLSMAEKALVELVVTLGVVFTGYLQSRNLKKRPVATLVLPVWTYEARLSTSPSSMRNGTSAPQGRPFNVTCQGDSNENGTFKNMRWLNPKGEKVSTGAEQVGNNTLLLTIEDPKQTDSGVYKCLAVYENNNMEIHVPIMFYEGPRPEFESSYVTSDVVEGDTVELWCQATGDEPLTYEWLDKNEEVISPKLNTSISVLTLANGSALIIDDVRLDHGGVYMCRASNSHGMSNKLYELIVGFSDGDDTDSIRDVRVVSITATSVRFSITTSEPVFSIDVKYDESSNPKVSEATFGTGMIYEISGLIPGGQYTFQFRPTSASYNASTGWTNPYQVTLLPDKPDVIFQSLTDDSLKIQWMRPVDDIIRETTDKFQLKYYTLQMVRGNSWEKRSCAITVELPTCRGSSYTIAGLSKSVYYEMELRAHTESGFGEAYTSKFYI